MVPYDDFLNIETPMGDVKIDKISLKDFIQDCVTESKKEDNLKYSDIYSFLGTKEVNQEYKGLEPHKVDSYLYCIHTVIKANYDILDVSDYNQEETRTPAVKKEFEYGDEENQTYVIQGHLFLQNKETKSKLVISMRNM